MKQLILLITYLLPFQLFSQSILFPGDLAIITVNADGAKNFDVLFLRDIEAGTVIHFTDNAWMNEQQAFRDSEGVLTFTATSAIAAGTVVSCPSKDGGNGFVESGNFNPAGSGDNIIAYQGSDSDPFFLFGVGWARGASVWEYSTVSASYRSDIPPGLSSDRYTITALGTSDNYRYRFEVLDSGYWSDVLSSIGNKSNYEAKNTDGFTGISESFTINEKVTLSDASGEWSSLSWDNGTPGDYTHATITGSVNIESSISCHSLTISSDASLEIHPGGSLTVNSIIDNQAGEDGLIIKADASGSGALYHACENVSGTVEVYLSPDQ